MMPFLQEPLVETILKAPVQGEKNIELIQAVELLDRLELERVFTRMKRDVYSEAEKLRALVIQTTSAISSIPEDSESLSKSVIVQLATTTLATSKSCTALLNLVATCRYLFLCFLWGNSSDDDDDFLDESEDEDNLNIWLAQPIPPNPKRVGMYGTLNHLVERLTATKDIGVY
jgi:hypothetical protein